MSFRRIQDTSFLFEEENIFPKLIKQSLQRITWNLKSTYQGTPSQSQDFEKNRYQYQEITGSPPTPSPQASSISLQKWEGVVLELKSDSFIARVYDLTQEGIEEEAEFPYQEVSEEDKSLIKPGAIFYWNISYVTKPNRQRTRESLIYFRRVPLWTKREIEKSIHDAPELRNKIFENPTCEG